MTQINGKVEAGSIEGYLQVVSAAAAIETEARLMLRQAVASARGAGNTWSSIGKLFGISKQAAQNRFAIPAMPADEDLVINERVLGPVNPIDEMGWLAIVGRHGWHSLERGANYHRIVHSASQWEHRRVSDARTASELVVEGWHAVGSFCPYVYLKRDLGTPAPEDPYLPDVPDN